VSSIIFSNIFWDSLRTKLLESNLESCAILRANVVIRGDKVRYLVKDIHIATDGDYSYRTNTSTQLKPEFIAPIVKLAKKSNQALIFVHTHPFTENLPKFSLIDDNGEKILGDFLKSRGLREQHAALVIAKNGCCARHLATNTLVNVINVNSGIEYIFSHEHSQKNSNLENFDRQIRAFGHEGQRIIESLKIGIVGVGGIGSIVAQQLAHLGVKNITLIDPDVVETTNLNRLAGSRRSDLGVSKVKVIKQQIESVSGNSVTSVQASVLDEKTALLLTDSDFFFCCTDSHGSRAVLNQLAYQYLIPCIDMGVIISHDKGVISHIAGRVQLLSPGESCLACTNLLDADTVRYDLMNSFQRQSDPYFEGDGEPQPAVMSINTTVAGLGVSMFLGAVTNIPMNACYQIYDGIRGKVHTVTAQKIPNCIVCSNSGALGRGDEWSLPARKS